MPPAQVSELSSTGALFSLAHLLRICQEESHLSGCVGVLAVASAKLQSQPSPSPGPRQPCQRCNGAACLHGERLVVVGEGLQLVHDVERALRKYAEVEVARRHLGQEARDAAA